MTIDLFLENGHGACVSSSLCVPALCGALCLLQRSAAALALPGGGWRPWRRQRRQCPVSTQYLHYIYTIYRVSALSTESPLSHCRGGDNAPAETRRGRPGAAAPRRNTETLIIFRLIMNTRQKCADWRRGIKKSRYIILNFFSFLKHLTSFFFIHVVFEIFINVLCLVLRNQFHREKLGGIFS